MFAKVEQVNRLLYTKMLQRMKLKHFELIQEQLEFMKPIRRLSR